MIKLQNLFKNYTGEEPDSITELPGAGSNRKYFRLTNGNTSLIGVIGTDTEENKAFISLSEHFQKKELPVPRVYNYTSDYSCYLQEDLGSLSLFESISQGRNSGQFNEKEKNILVKTIEKLPAFQFKGAEGLNFSICYPQSEFNKRTVLWDLNYFKYCFLKISGVEFQENILENDFEKFAEVLLKDQTDTLLYRDFQSRNVMIYHGEPFFIDFQGGRKGPVFYDVASFLWQAKACYPEELREELLQKYLTALSEYTNVDETGFRARLKYFVLFRTLQVLGAYGFRGYLEKKAHFIESIPPAISNLKGLLKEDYPECPYLVSILKQLADLDKFNERKKNDGLEITVYSFSYKKGIPDDNSGNGGGYVFDCRAIHNPGKYQEYKKLTGIDQPVIDFLEKDGEIIPFLENIYELADKHTERYLERGFTNLMFSFGCTGGQHRSVYSAQHLAEHLARKYPVRVILEHREQGIHSIY